MKHNNKAYHFRMTMVLFSFAAIIFVSARFAGAEVALTEKKNYYDVTGQSLRDVRGNIFAVTPIDVKGRKYAALCHHDIRWHYKYDSDIDWCMIKSVSVTVTITYTMPRWVDYASASSDKQEKWNRYFARLSEHEEEHAKMAKEAARDIDREIGNAKRRSCQELRGAVNEIGTGILKSLDDVNDNFDDKTVHGHLQDAMLHEF